MNSDQAENLLDVLNNMQVQYSNGFVAKLEAALDVAVIGDKEEAIRYWEKEEALLGCEVSKGDSLACGLVISSTEDISPLTQMVRTVSHINHHLYNHKVDVTGRYEIISAGCLPGCLGLVVDFKESYEQTEEYLNGTLKWCLINTYPLLYQTECGMLSPQYITPKQFDILHARHCNAHEREQNFDLWYPSLSQKSTKKINTGRKLIF